MRKPNDRAKRNDQVTLRVPGKTDYLDVIRAVVVRVARRMGFPEEAASEIEMAVDEACANIIVHGYAGLADREPIDLEIHLDHKAIMIFIADRGESFSPVEVEAKDVKRHILEKTGRGLGIYIIRRFMDRVEHTYRPGLGNELKLVRYLDTEVAPSGGVTPAAP